MEKAADSGTVGGGVSVADGGGVVGWCDRVVELALGVLLFPPWGLPDELPPLFETDGVADDEFAADTLGCEELDRVNAGMAISAPMTKKTAAMITLGNGIASSSARSPASDQGPRSSQR